MRELKWMGEEEKTNPRKQSDQRKKMESFTHANPGGESAKQVYDRMDGVIKNLYIDFAKKDFPEVVVMVSHGITIKVFLMKLLGWPHEAYEVMGTPDNCQIFRLDLNDKGEYSLTTPFPRK